MSPTPEDNKPPRLSTELSDGITHVRFPRNHTDGICVRELYEFAAELSEGRDTKLHVIMTNLQMVTSGMAGILVQIQKMFKDTDAQLNITVADDLMYMQFQAMHMHLLLNLFYDADEAVAAFK